MAHFLDIHLLNKHELTYIFDLTQTLKAALKNKETVYPLKDRQLAMIFEKPSTRTRTSFEVGINQLGGNALVIHAENSQLGRGETPSDTAKVLSRYVDLIMVRCFSHEMLLDLAQHATVPIINGLTDFSHPCQVMADIFTFIEHRGDISGKKVAWLGDGNNMVNSWIHAAITLGFELHIATPEKYKPSEDVLDWSQNQSSSGKIIYTTDPHAAAQNADLITTDTWVSMGDKDASTRHKLLAPFQVNQTIMDLAHRDAIFMHCLPAHREEEVTSQVIDGPQSVVFDEAENRLHVQKAIMIWCLKNSI